MPEIKAFRAWRYNPGMVKKLGSVYAPPYDVISKAGQEKLYRASPFNVIRLELGKEKKGDSAAKNKYTRAAAYLNDWKTERVLIQEDEPALYVYLQDYVEEGKPAGGGSASGGKKARIGFFAAMRLDEKSVLKHENTLAAPKKDRLALLKEVRTNLSPVFGLFEDKKGTVHTQLKKSLKQRPIVDVILDGVRHRLFVETRSDVIVPVLQAMRSKPMFIADGHHRFEVACQFRDWVKAQGFCAAGAEYALVYFADSEHNPFKIFPTHRLVRLAKKNVSLPDILKKYGSLEKARNLEAVLRYLSKNREETRDKKYNFGIYTKKDGFYIFTLDPGRSGLKKYFANGGASFVDKLDVAVLHRFLIEPCFGIRSIEKSDAIDFTRDAKEAVEKVRKTDFDAAIFLRPTSLKEMMLASKKGLKMPQKSTYFYPKLLSGLVFHSLEEKKEACCCHDPATFFATQGVAGAHGAPQRGRRKKVAG